MMVVNIIIKLFMKKIIIVSVISTFFIPFLFSQNVDHFNGSRFSKIVEFNNPKSKGLIEMLLLGDNNAPVEFFFNPSSESMSCIPVGFRISNNSSTKLHNIEIKYIANYNDEKHILSKIYDAMGIPENLVSSIPEDFLYQIELNNRNFTSKIINGYPECFDIEVISFTISKRFAEKLYKNMVSFIKNFKAESATPFISDSYSVKFRSVVDDEVWSLWIQDPRGISLKMSDICRQIIADGLANKFDEAKYMSVLNSFEN